MLGHIIQYHSMLDQSFTVSNFRSILDLENRKGVHLEHKLSIVSVRDKNFEIKETSRKLQKAKKLRRYSRVDELKIRLIELRNEKEYLLEEELGKIAETVASKGFRINLEQVLIPGGKPIYTTQNQAENFFATRQLQRNIARLYKVKQSNRDEIIRQLIGILEDRFPKIVIRTDIKNFYESISQELILKKINDNLLTPLSKRLIRSLLKDYNSITGASRGVPRGIGVSAYLTELVMRDVDKALLRIESVSYYARYVDDIVIVFTPSISQGGNDFRSQISGILKDQFDLTLNSTKTKVCDVRVNATSCNIDFLGYKILFGPTLKVSLSHKKKEKYKSRIMKAFEVYENYSKINRKEAQRVLIKRIRFLTGNTKLKNNKKNILVGVYHSNKSLTETSDFHGIDNYLNHQINTSSCSERLKNKLRMYKFVDGFVHRRFSPFKLDELSQITSIW